MPELLEDWEGAPFPGNVQHAHQLAIADLAERLQAVRTLCAGATADGVPLSPQRVAEVTLGHYAIPRAGDRHATTCDLLVGRGLRVCSCRPAGDPGAVVEADPYGRSADA